MGSPFLCFAESIWFYAARDCHWTMREVPSSLGSWASVPTMADHLDLVHVVKLSSALSLIVYHMTDFGRASVGI